MHALRTVFFDVGNTLLFPDQDRIYPPLWNLGISPPAELLRQIECRTKREFDAAMRHHAPDHGFWFLFYSHLLNELGITNHEVRDQLVAATRISANWARPRAGTREVLERIDRDYDLAVISNADGTIADTLRASGIADCFPSITDSGIVGIEKPHGAIFHAALEQANAEAASSLYVGDIYSVDYLGATRAGMQAILFDACGAYRDTKWPRVESLEELEQRLTAK
jgi:putative hydrolase of the HAD superfamily